MAKPGALATLDHDDVIAQLSAGRLLKQIAAQHGVDKTAIYRKVRHHPDYQDAIQQQAESLVEQAIEQVFECSSDTVNIARARVDAAFKWAAARDAKNWGAKQQIEHTGTVSIDFSQRLRQAERIIDGECSAPLITDTVSIDTAQSTDSDIV